MSPRPAFLPPTLWARCSQPLDCVAQQRVAAHPETAPLGGVRVLVYGPCPAGWELTHS